MPSTTSKETVAYGMKEKADLKSFFTGCDEFKVQRSTEPGKREDCMKIKQSAWDMGQDRMELKDKQNDKVVAVVRRARASIGACFYIYTVEKPYPGAQKNSWNEELDGTRLYCFGFLKAGWGSSYYIHLYYADPEKGPDPDGKDPYKEVYQMSKPDLFSTETLVKAVGENGEVKDESEVVAFVSRDRWQWNEANQYTIEVAPGVDAGLMVIAMAMKDEIQEDQGDSLTNQ